MRSRLLLAMIAATLAGFAYRAAGPPLWHTELETALAHARAQDELILCRFALPGRPLDGDLEIELRDAELSRELAHDWTCVRFTATEHAQRFSDWVGGGPGMALVILDDTGAPLGARRGFAGAVELRAWLTHAKSLAPRIGELRRAQSPGSPSPGAQLELGELYLELGGELAARRELEAAARAGERDAHLALAQLDTENGAWSSARAHLAAWRDAPSASGAPRAAWVEARILHGEYRSSEACEQLEVALARYRATPFAEKLRAELANVRGTLTRELQLAHTNTLEGGDL